MAYSFNVVSTVGLIFEFTLFPGARMKKGPVCIHHSCVRKNKFSMKLEVTQCLLFWEIVSLQVSNLQVVHWPSYTRVWRDILGLRDHFISGMCKIKICQLNYNLKLSLSLHQMTPLHVAAAKGGRISILKYIIDKEDIKDDNGVSETRVLIQQSVVVREEFISLQPFTTYWGMRNHF